MSRKKYRCRKPAAAKAPPVALLPLGAMLFGMTMMPSAMAAETAAKEATLATVEVKEQQEAETQDGYQATKTRVGKVLQDPHDIPQAVTTVTNKLMEEQQVGSLREALRNVSGLTFNAAEGGRSGDNMMLRGFYTFGDTYLDGIRDTAQYNRETFNLEQVDVLRGSAAMLFGRGQAGGVINQVSKVPLRKDQYRFTGSLGTEGYQEITADLNKRLGDSTAMRVNLMNRDEGSWRSNPVTGDEPEIHRRGIAASIATGLRTDNEFVLSHVYTRTRDIPDYGFSFDSSIRKPNKNFPVEYFWGIDRNFDDSDTHITTGTWTHRFSPVSELRTAIRYADYERSYWASAPSSITPPDADGNSPKTRMMDYETLTLQSDFNTRFRALGMKHEFLAGVEYLHEDSYRIGLQDLGGYYKPYVGSTTASPVKFKGDSYAAYVQDTVEFMPFWKATLGVRRDELDAEYSSTTSPSLRYGEWSYRAALSWQPREEQHYYLSWSDSFSPTADLYQLTLEPQPPERSQVYELGAKFLFFDGDLALRGALFRAEKEWERNTDLESTASVLTKKRRTDGIELEAAGRLTDNWEVFAGVALMDAEILEVAEQSNGTVANPEYKGKRPRNTPPYTFNLWTTYKLPGGWKIGGGVEAKGERYGYNPSSAGPVPTLNGKFHPNTAPAYARWDAMVAYEQKNWALRLNIRNLFDEVWYDAIYDQGGFVVPGAGRQAILTGELKF
ncbi:TonB-dependent siderophore receptor [Betaproteobacteria bacterium SCN2]|jgi:catecholate siderophore receptor|nr:TonB-dependent siderophore receptor [Betaproteobacteria bacterium SCN2]